ncbi:MAG: hypothetical protein IPL34_20070 [Thiofilum sp.]|uniref:hypothetical protein n=1 Tax=Thiofilum sp. TaxID=2212733 RepID=UPI0025D1BCD1|nr:hypothetical protein [Thiofilum sp.]MBK8455580.1 hypothetical protein [Thiofilum sp.]
MLDEFFALSEKMRGYVQAEYEAHLRETKAFEAIVKRWQMIKNEKKCFLWIMWDGDFIGLLWKINFFEKRIRKALLT